MVDLLAADAGASGSGPVAQLLISGFFGLCGLVGVANFRGVREHVVEGLAKGSRRESSNRRLANVNFRILSFLFLLGGVAGVIDSIVKLA